MSRPAALSKTWGMEPHGLFDAGNLPFFGAGIKRFFPAFELQGPRLPGDIAGQTWCFDQIPELALLIPAAPIIQNLVLQGY